jgi:uncharacterized iron-regulated membrane protein
MQRASTVARVPNRRARVRLLWMKIHRWIGLALLVVFAAFAITGALLVWPDHFDRLLNPARYPPDAAATPAPPSVFIKSAQSALPRGDLVSAIRYPTGITAVRVAGQVNGPAPLDLGPPSRTTVWLDPGSGTVLAAVRQTGGFQWTLRALHGHLLLATYGREVVALVGIVLLASAGTGLWLWWPGLRNVGRALKWRRQASLSMNLHRHGGALVVVILIVEALTGVYVSVPRLFSAIVEPTSTQATGVEVAEGPPLARTIARPRQDIDQVLASAQTLFPGSKTLTIFLPTEGSGQWIVNLATGNGERSVHIADDSGETKTLTPPEPGVAKRVEHVMEDIHFGNYGPLWQLIVFLCGVTLALLSITGPLLWLQGRALRGRRAQAA